MEHRFFDFLAEIPAYAEKSDAVHRLNQRHRMIIAPLARDIDGARVLDLAAHDGRWAHAFADSGAREVLGIEGRPELVARYDSFPNPETRAKVRLDVGDIFDGLDDLVSAGETFGVVAVLGIFYHIMDHFRLLRQVKALQPRLVILDSEFALRPGPVIVLSRERTDNPLNATAQTAGQGLAAIGIPSPLALELMAETLGYKVDWLDWEKLPKADRTGLGDYYRTEKKVRATCLLRPA